MGLTRRGVLGGTAALGGLMALPRMLVAEIQAGGGTVTSVSDGHLVLPGGYGDSLPQAELAEILAEFGEDPERREPPCNLTLFRDGTNTVLFDAGSGPSFMPSAGRIMDSLDAVGVAPEEITHLVMTHAHPDHVWGLLDDFDEPAFPQAAHLIGRAEWAYWMDPALVETIAPERQSFVVGAQRRLSALEDRITLIEDGDDVAPGVAAIATPGHTPGHMSFEIGGDGGVFVLGDAVTNGHFNFRHPGWAGPNDQNPEEAAATRLTLMDRLAAGQGAVLGFHLPGGGWGRVARADGGYRLVGLDG